MTPSRICETSKRRVTATSHGARLSGVGQAHAASASDASAPDRPFLRELPDCETRSSALASRPATLGSAPRECPHANRRVTQSHLDLGTGDLDSAVPWVYGQRYFSEHCSPTTPSPRRPSLSPHKASATRQEASRGHTFSFPGIPAADVCDRLIGSPRLREPC